jgi:hypothetical protein
MIREVREGPMHLIAFDPPTKACLGSGVGQPPPEAGFGQQDGVRDWVRDQKPARLRQESVDIRRGQPGHRQVSQVCDTRLPWFIVAVPASGLVIAMGIIGLLHNRALGVTLIVIGMVLTLACAGYWRAASRD